MKSIKVLIVEDSLSDAELLSENIMGFRNIKCGITLVNTVKHAVQKLEAADYDVIFLDLNLPDSSGFDTVMKINDKKKKSALIIMTSVSQQETIAKSLNIGVQNFIIKGEETPASLERAVMFSIEREKSIEDLKESKMMLKTILNNAPVIMFSLDSKGRTIQANLEAEKFGLKNPGVPLGKPKGEIFDCVNSFKAAGGCGHSRECDACQLTAVIKDVFVMGKSVRRKEITYTIIINNRPVEKIMLVSAEKIETDSDSSVLVSMEDLTEIRAAEIKTRESEEKFRSAFEQAAVGMAYATVDGKFIQVNRRFCELIGYPKEEAEKLRFQDITHPETKEQDILAAEDLVSGKISVYKKEKQYIRKDKSLIWIELTASLIRNPDNSPKYFVTVVEDISRRKQAEAEDAIFNELQAAILQAGSIKETFRIISDKTRQYLGSGVLLATYLDDTVKGFRVMAYSGLDEPIEKIVQSIKMDPTKIIYELGKIDEARLRPFNTGKLERIKDGLYGLSVGFVPKVVCDILAKALKADYVYAIGFLRGNRHFGSLNIISPASIEQHKNIIERMVRYSAAVIERKIAEEALRASEEKWAGFSDSANDILTIWDKNLKLVAANKAAYDEFKKISGIEMAPGKSILRLSNELKIPAQFKRFLSVMRSKTPRSVVEYGFARPGGEQLYYTFKAFALPEGTGLIISNVTELKRSEMILKQSFEKLREADRLKSNFISIISHELRTPLTIIKGFTSFLIKEAAGPLNDTQKNFVNTIDLNTARLARIINDMVDVSKIESGTMSIEKENRDMVGVINEAVDGMRHITEGNGIRLETEIEIRSAPAEIDKGRMMQTMTNLINNAMRFTTKGGIIKAGIKSAAEADVPGAIATKMGEEKNYYYIYVSDDGAGIEKKYLDKIFERFYQVENANTRKHQGAGLGLSIAKTIIEAHGGFIWAESGGPGKGTRICILIPE